MRPMDAQQQIDTLQQRVAELEARLTPAAATPATTAPVTATDTVTEAPRSSRRGLLKLAGAAAVGAVAAGATGAQQAAATNGEAVTIGQWKTGTSPTRTDLDGSAGGGQAFLFQAGTGSNGIGYLTSAALCGMTYNAGVGTGVFGLTSIDGGSGVYGNNEHSTAHGAGVTGVTNSALSQGVRGWNPLGVGVKGDGKIALAGVGSIYGLMVEGTRAAITFHATQGAPGTRSDAHLVGDIDLDVNGELWLCVAAGIPGIWRKLGGGAAAGQFHAVSPFRVYDSRKPAPVHPISTGQNRLVPVGHAIDANGAVIPGLVVPNGASAIMYNLTVVNTVGSNGWLAVNPAGVTTVSASTINWSASGLSLANASVVPLDATKNVTVVCGGTGTSANFIIDVVGYYQ